MRLKRTVGAGGLGSLLCLMVLTGCASTGKALSPAEGPAETAVEGLERVQWWSAPEFADDLSVESLVSAGRESLRYYASQAPDKAYRFGSDIYTASELGLYLKAFLEFAGDQRDESEIRDYLKETSRVYRGGDGRQVHVTGYYEPVLEGSTLPGIFYNVPLYGMPKDMIVVDLGKFLPAMKGKRLVGRYRDGALVPYYSRHQIDRMDALAGRGYELAWLKDPVEAFFLQIQGSGKIVLPDGSVMSLSYAGNNGRPYRSVGRLLVETGKIPAEDLSADAIRMYLKDNPQEVSRVLDYNERYIFFEEGPAGGPTGSLGVVLTPERSVATDAACYPKGAMAYLETEVPEPGEDGMPMTWKKTCQFVFNQDTGGAIVGPRRADLFFGTGATAGDRAGVMSRSGKIFLLPRKAALVRHSEGFIRLTRTGASLP